MTEGERGINKLMQINEGCRKKKDTFELYKSNCLVDTYMQLATLT